MDMEEIRVRNAVIEDMFSDRGTVFVTIRYGDCSRCREQRVTLVVNRTTTVIDEQGREMPANGLEEGMLIDAVFSQTMTRSIPPQSQAFDIQVVSRPRHLDTTFGRIVEVNTREHFINYQPENP